MSDIKKRLGRRVRELRKKGGFTISQLAEAADLSDNYVGFIERGVRTPTIETLAKLACALKTDISELFYFPDATSAGREQALKKLLYQLKDKNTEGIELIAEISKNVFGSAYGRRKRRK